jgi:type IV pilus assembly protein PilY1
MIKEVIPMKFKKFFCLFLFLQFLLFAAHSFAKDTDLYVDSESTIEPNILIIFDTSGSMDQTPGDKRYCTYDPNFTYPQPASIPSVDRDKVYRMNNNQWFQGDKATKYKDCIYSSQCSNYVKCPQAQTELTKKGDGLYNGRPDNDTCSGGSRYTIATGNWLRFNYADAGLVEACSNSKLEIAKGVITDFLDDVQGVRVGVMIFNDEFQRASDREWETEGGRIGMEVKTLDTSYRNALTSYINSIETNSWTPLAETLYEAGLYFQGVRSYFNSPPFKSPETTYTSPIEYYCQKNYVIIMTDGLSTVDRNAILNTAIGDRNADQKEPPGAPKDPKFSSEGTHFLDDVAKYLYDTDLNSMQGKQNVVTYTIGFELDKSAGSDAPKAKELLQSAATLGHGKFYTTEGGSAGLADAFAKILNEVLAKTSSFVAPIVPVSKMERTTAGDKIYLAFFRPNQSGMWSGNIKKYGVAQSNDPSKGTVVGDILDSSGSKALDSRGEFFPSSQSFWTTSSNDGGEVEVGGVGEKLLARSTARNIYTLLPGDASDEDDGPDSNTSFDLTNSWNAFTTANSRLTTSKLGVSTTDEKNKLIDFVRGIDTYDDNLNGDTDDKRDWMLGSFLHSRPYIIHYADRTVIYAGSNDGMLHAFDDDSGDELWGFIPPCLLDRLQELHTETPGIFVDGSPKAYVTYDGSGNVTKAILIFGLRRGGNYYYALDVTNPLVPKYLWRIYKNRKNQKSGWGGGSFTSYYQELGQTWSTPVIGKVAFETGEKWVVIFGAGYDDGQDVVSNPPSDDVGRGIYIADVLTGDCIWYDSRAGGDTNMTYCIPSDVATLDLDGDGRIDRLYVGDVNARMWRFDLTDGNPDHWTGRMIFKSNSGSSEKRKIFYPPDVTLEKDSTGEYEMLFFGTGDREDPKGTKDKDRIYAFKDKNASTTKGESDLVDVTGFYELSADQQAAKLNEIKSQYGWFIQLDKKDGEKCLATPVVYNKIAYFTSFSPSTEAIDDPCFIGEGTASLYAVNYSTGEAAFNLDLTNDTGGTVIKKSDRSSIIGSAIPSGVVITVIGGQVTAYIGVGGGVNRPTLSSSRSMFPVHWKLVF